MKFSRKIIAPIIIAAIVPPIIIGTDLAISSAVTYIYQFVLLGFLENETGSIFSFLLIFSATIFINTCIACFNSSLEKFICSLVVIILLSNYLLNGSISSFENVYAVLFTIVYYFISSFFGQTHVKKLAVSAARSIKI